MGFKFDEARRVASIYAVSILLCLTGRITLAADGSDTAKAEQHFDVQEYRVIGNTALAGRDIEKLLYPLLGPNKSLPDVESARAALETLYHDRGYGTVFVDIPPQKVDEGIVRLRVTEGRVERETISGAHYFPERDVIAALPAAQPGGVLQLSKLQEELTAVNTQSPDRSVVPILKGGDRPGDRRSRSAGQRSLAAARELGNQ